MTSFHRVGDPSRKSEAIGPNVEKARRPFRLSWKVAVLLLAIALLANMSVMSLLHKHTPLPPSVVLPNVAQLQELRVLTAENPTRAEFHLTLAQSYLHYKHYLSARDEFAQALKYGADEWAVRTGDAEAALAVQRSDAAEQDMRRMIQMHPARLETYLTLAETQQHADDWPGAKQTLDGIPRDKDGLPTMEGERLPNAELLATAYSHIDAWDKATGLIQACLKIDPARQSSRIMLGKALHATGKQAEAIPYLAEGVKLAPKNAELQYLLGTAYQVRNQPNDKDRAFACFQMALVADERHGAATLALAREFDRRGLKAPAAIGYQRAYKLGMEGNAPLLRSGDLLMQIGQKEEGHYRRGLYFESVNKPDLAVKEYFFLNKMHAYCRSSYIHIARAYGAMHKADKTLAYLRLAQQHDPERAHELDWSIIQAYGDLRNEKVRIDALKALVARNDKESNEARYQLASSADTAGNFDEEVRWLRDCIQHDPKDGVFRTDLGKVLLQQRSDPAKLREATQELEQAIQLAPENYEAFYYLGLAYNYQDRKEDAVLALRHSVDLQPEDGEGYQTLAMALNRAGRKTEAADALTLFKQFEEFLKARETLAARCKRRPNDAEAQRRMAEFHMKAHEYNAAIERYKKCLVIQPDNRQVRARMAEACGYMGRREEQKEQLAMLSQPPGANP